MAIIVVHLCLKSFQLAHLDPISSVTLLFSLLFFVFSFGLSTSMLLVWLLDDLNEDLLLAIRQVTFSFLDSCLVVFQGFDGFLAGQRSDILLSRSSTGCSRMLLTTFL